MSRNSVDVRLVRINIKDSTATIELEEVGKPGKTYSKSCDAVNFLFAMNGLRGSDGTKQVMGLLQLGCHVDDMFVREPGFYLDTDDDVTCYMGQLGRNGSGAAHQLVMLLAKQRVAQALRTAIVTEGDHVAENKRLSGGMS